MLFLKRCVLLFEFFDVGAGLSKVFLERNVRFIQVWDP
jgi:hypothetical protein